MLSECERRDWGHQMVMPISMTDNAICVIPVDAGLFPTMPDKRLLYG